MPRPLSRSGVNKSRSARAFRSKSRRSASANVRQAPMRGGWRF
nr:MAG: hypothetical protein [Microvirus sp.]